MESSTELAHIIQEMKHRVVSLDKQSRELKTLSKKVTVHSDIQRKTMKEECARITAELDKIQEDIHTTISKIHTIGHALKRCIRIQEFNLLREQVDGMQFEELLRRPQLLKDFSHYAKE
jgi:hypothetical protein